MGVGGSLVFADPINTTDFVTTWNTNGGACSSCIFIPAGGSNDGYDYDVDWNSDGVFDEFNLDSFETHDFETPGEYTIRIRGDFPQIDWGGTEMVEDRWKLRSVDQWGSIEWHSMESAFVDTPVHIAATDTPDLSQVTNMNRMFYDAGSATGDLSDWDTSNVTSMRKTFSGVYDFTSDLSGWDVSNVTTMYKMFLHATSFNSDDLITPSVSIGGASGALTGTPTIPATPTFSGKATPGAQVRVTVHSDPVICETTADGNGDWSCTLPTPLPAGAHTVYVRVVNPDSSVQELGPYAVTVAGQGATITNGTPLAPNSGTGSEVNIALATGAVGTMTASLVGYWVGRRFLMVRRRDS